MSTMRPPDHRRREPPASSAGPEPLAVRAEIRGHVQGVGLREWARERARELSLSGWVRNDEDGAVRVHAEGMREGVQRLVEMLGYGPRHARVDELEVREVPVEGHEQFAIRGVPAGAFAVLERPAERGPRYVLRLEVDGAPRSWSLAREPSMDPAEKRGASELPAHTGPDSSRGSPSGAQPDTPRGEEEGRVWDEGSYEQGGRVPWPEALERGHAVFVLHGERLRGGFALQRIRPGPRPQWLLIKRRDEAAVAPGAGR